MGRFGKFVILEPNVRSAPIKSFEELREFDDMFNETYNDIEHALLWIDTIVRAPNYNYHLPREQLLQYATNPIKLRFMDRLASFPKNLKFVAKKMALHFINKGISLESMPKTQGFNLIVAVIILAVLHCFLIETEYDDIFDRIKINNHHEFQVFFKLINHEHEDEGRSILKAAQQLSTIIGLSGFLNNESPQFDQIPREQRQELINLLQDASKKVRIYARIEDGPESPPSEQAMSMLGSQPKSIQVMNAEAVERIRSKIAASRHSRRGGKRRKSSNHAQRRKKNGKRFKRTMKH